MKKFIIGILLALFVSSAFAIETKYNSFGFHFSVPLIFESGGEKNGVKADSSMTSIGFGLHALSLYTDRLGFYVNMDLVFPQKIKMDLSYGGSSYSYELSRSDYNSLWGMAALLGPGICLTHSESMLFTISPGVHYMMLVADSGSNDSVSFIFGIGANIQDSIFFAENGYFTIGADIAFDFLGFVMANGHSNSTDGHDFIINPKIGVGFKFN
ncbi:MAG: hypothetical protein J6Y60_12770 [Treponema sp.]|nr:hypothetical protein [Treponema sp.]